MKTGIEKMSGHTSPKHRRLRGEAADEMCDWK